MFLTLSLNRSISIKCTQIMISKHVPNLVIAASAISGVLLIVSGLSDLRSQDHIIVSKNPAFKAVAEKNHTFGFTQSRVSSDFGSAPNAQSGEQGVLHSGQNDAEELDTEGNLFLIDSLAALESHLEETAPDAVDFDSVVKLINESDSAFDYVVREYLATPNEDFKHRVLLNALNNTSNPARVNLAVELASSSHLQTRRTAYSWLSRSEGLASELVYQALVDASYYEQDSEALAQLVVSMPLNEFSRTSGIRERAILRLNDLAFHPDEIVSSKAIERISEAAINPNTVRILQQHLQDSSEHRQLAALNGLKNLGHPSDEVMSSLNAILHDPNLPQKNRATAARVLIDFENQLHASQGL